MVIVCFWLEHQLCELGKALEAPAILMQGSPTLELNRIPEPLREQLDNGFPFPEVFTHSQKAQRNL